MSLDELKIPIGIELKVWLQIPGDGDELHLYHVGEVTWDADMTTQVLVAEIQEAVDSRDHG